jgi:integrase
VLRRILEDALKGKNPMRDIKIPAIKEYKPHVITSKEFQIIHDRVKGTDKEMIILLAAWCGLRRGEIFALKWNDIDWNNNLIRIDESRCISEEGYIDKDTKSKNGMRQIAAPEYLIGLIEKYRLSQGKFTERLFSLKPASCTDWFGKLAIRLKLPNIHFHDLRHYHASWLYEMKIPDQYAAERLGHDIHVLKSIYQHLGLDRKVEIDESIKKIIPLQER